MGKTHCHDKGKTHCHEGKTMTRTRLITTRRPLQQLPASHASKLLQGSCQGNGERCLQPAHNFYIPYIRLNNDDQTALILSAKNYPAAIAKPLSVKLLPKNPDQSMQGLLFQPKFNEWYTTLQCVLVCKIAWRRETQKEQALDDLP